MLSSLYSSIDTTQFCFENDQMKTSELHKYYYYSRHIQSPHIIVLFVKVLLEFMKFLCFFLLVIFRTRFHDIGAVEKIKLYFRKIYIFSDRINKYDTHVSTYPLFHIYISYTIKEAFSLINNPRI